MTLSSQHPVTASGNSDLALLGAVLGIDEPAVLALGGGIGFMAASFNYEEVATLTFVFRAHPVPFVDAVLEGSGTGASLSTTTSAAKAQRELSAAMEAGDRVLGYVMIPGENWGEAVVRELTADGEFELAKATKKKQFWLARIPAQDGAVQSPIIATETYAAAARESALRMLNKTQPEGVPASFAKNFGVSGIRKLADATTDGSARGWGKLFGDPSRRAVGFEMALKFLNGTAHGGRGGLRHQFAEVVQRAGADPVPYRALGADWEEFATLMATAQSEPASSYSEFLEKAHAQLHRIADAEEAAALALLAAID
ncbi:hypothetical protein [Neomicrococcus lactis]|uniref:DUF4872 domain-containing protein n=1 Tax=Neomicrococcus lactis TaxID=732241 RepID=A0A7W9DAS1_9MICC|nr:hypothetical protein [Neomicrococcus lactis]MBB5597112.1 hypothetical protein [Neomicrococcus lactis]